MKDDKAICKELGNEFLSIINSRLPIRGMAFILFANAPNENRAASYAEIGYNLVFHTSKGVVGYDDLILWNFWMEQAKVIQQRERNAVNVTYSQCGVPGNNSLLQEEGGV